MKSSRITIIGGGIQGSCLALALAKKGIRSTILERNSAPMLEASLRNEGKIHLGFVYSLDDKGKTRKLMLDGALSFAPLLESWCHEINWNELRSKTFNYAVMPDSIMNPSRTEESFSYLEKLLNECEYSRDNYIGEPIDYFWRKLDDTESSPIVDNNKIKDLYQTQEVSVDPRIFAKLISNELKINPLIKVICNSNVENVSGNDSFSLTVTSNNQLETLNSDIVINCAWEDKERLDRQIRLKNKDLNYRIKHQILVKPKHSISNLQPTTLIQGPYGDIVPWNDGLVYISWYPECRTYFDSVPPKILNDKDLAITVAKNSLSIMQEMFPCIKDANIISSLAGVILAKGSSDVDNIHSKLHNRDAIGITQRKNWISIDTGKFTTAPLFADKAANLISEL